MNNGELNRKDIDNTTGENSAAVRENDASDNKKTESAENVGASARITEEAVTGEIPKNSDITGNNSGNPEVCANNTEATAQAPQNQQNYRPSDSGVYSSNVNRTNNASSGSENGQMYGNSNPGNNGGYYHNRYSGNYYDPRMLNQNQGDQSYRPMNYRNPYEQGYNTMGQQEMPKKKKSKAPLIAALIAGCVVISTLFGVGGALITNRVINNSNVTTGGNVSNSTNGIISDGDDAADSNKGGAANSNPSVIFKIPENVDNTGRYSDNPIVNAASVAKPSVVEITTETVQTNAFYGQYVTQGAGSGVIITEDGYIITCAHVIDGATNVIVRLTDGTEAQASIIGSDSRTDIAVIKLNDIDGLTPAVIGNSDSLLVGETAIAIGNPLGELGGSVSSGIISALDREIEIEGDRYNLLQTTAAINPGNSGGGLFNVNGELIGIVNAKQAGSSIEGLGFSIPINKAVEIAEQLINTGYIAGRPRLGITVSEINSSNLYDVLSKNPQLRNYVTDYGVYFLEYDASQTGDLKFGDRIIAIDGVTTAAFSDIRTALYDYEIGDTVVITVARLTTNGRVTQSKMVEVSLTLIEEVPENSAQTGNEAAAD